MKIWVRGSGHLAQTHARAYAARGWAVEINDLGQGIPDVFVCARDVLDHGSADLARAREWFEGTLPLRSEIHEQPIVLVSQVPPGTTRAWAKKRKDVYYQVDTIIVENALERVLRPEQIIVGCADPTEPLPLAYQEYLLAHDCPVLKMTYEEAEVAKCAINFMLAKQIEAACVLQRACHKVDANYAAVREALHGDARIGERAYLRPGKLNQHLRRDVDTLLQLVGDK